ncbi:MAG: hypothetical protein WC717_01200 [Candidatus Micrarchaeia archaeon]|jgi:hypothetical protein
MKFDRNAAAAMLIVILLPLGIGQFVQKTTLPEYGAAMEIRGMVSGASGAPHIAAAAALEQAYASLIGAPAASAGAIVGFLLIFPPLLLACASLLLYLACRELGYKKTESVFAVALFSLSATVAQAFLPGVYGSAQLAMFLFAAFLLPFAMFAKDPKRAAVLVPAALLGFCAAYVNAAFALPGAAAAVAFAFAARGNGGKGRLALLGCLALVFAAAGFLSPDKSMLAFSQESLAQAAEGMPFLFAAAAICMGLFFFGRRDSEHFALLVLALALCGFSPLAASLLLVFPVAEGAARVSGEISKGAKLAGAFACGFFMVFGLIYPGSSIYPALGAGLMLGVLAPLVLHFYEYNAKAVFSVMGAGLVLFSLFFAMFSQLPPLKQEYPAYTSPALAAALSYLSEINAPRLATLERADALAFYLPGAQLEQGESVEDFLVSGGSLGGARLLLSLPSLEALSQKGGFEVYYFDRNYSNQEGGPTYALFYSLKGRLISREMAGGWLALKDGAALDRYGSYYAPIALPRMVMLSGSLPAGDSRNRMLLLEEGVAPPRVVGIYSGKESGVVLEKEFAGVSVYKVE